MGNPHSYTSKYVSVVGRLEAATKPLRSAKARKEAMERAATMPNRLPPLARAALIQGAK
jgi:hypothetical protein